MCEFCYEDDFDDAISRGSVDYSPKNICLESRDEHLELKSVHRQFVPAVNEKILPSPFVVPEAAEPMKEI